MNRKASIISLALLVAILGGCSNGFTNQVTTKNSDTVNTPVNEDDSSSSGQDKGQAEAGSDQSEALEPEVEPEETEAISAVDELLTIAIASCEKAMGEGVVERSTDPTGYTLVMVPKDQAIDGYSAAYFLPPDTYELIWETDVFYSCELANSFWLASEAGAELEAEVSFDPDTGTYLVTQDFGEWGLSATSFEVVDGLLVSAVNLNSDAEKYLIEYGDLEDVSLEIIRNAVQLFSEQ